MLESQSHTVHWLQLDAEVEAVWKELLDFFSDGSLKTLAETMQLGLYDTSGGVTWIDSKKTSVGAVLEHVVRACEQRQRFSVVCHCENGSYTFLPPSRNGSTVSHPQWQVLVALKEVPPPACSDALAERLLAHGFVER